MLTKLPNSRRIRKFRKKGDWMTNGWQTVPLGDFLAQRKKFFTINDFTRYKRARVQLHGKGIVLRDEVDGVEVKTKEQQAARTGEFLVAEIDAKVGGFGIVPPELDSTIVSSHYFLFEIDEKKCLREWLDWFIRSGMLEEQVTAQGSTNYSAIRPSHVLKYKLPLPPLTEQRRIVARIKALAARVAEAQSLRREASEEAEVLAFATARKLFSNLDNKITELGNLVDETRNGIQTGPFGAQLGSGDFLETGHPVITIGNVQYSGLEIGKLKFISEEKAKQLSRFLVQEGDILFARMGTVGRCCVVPKEAEGWIFNYHLIRVALDKSRVEPRYIHWLIRASQDIEDKLGDEIRGATRQGVNSKIVASLPCRVPPLEEQRRLVAYLDGLQAQMSALRAVQAETERGLSALMPSILDKAFKGEL